MKPSPPPLDQIENEPVPRPTARVVRVPRDADDLPLAAARARFILRSKSFAVLRAEAVFLAGHLLLGIGGTAGLIVLSLVGAAVGVLWYVLDAGPGKCAATGAPAFFLATIPFTPGPMILFAFLVTLGFAGFCLATGLGREHRQADGEE